MAGNVEEPTICSVCDLDSAVGISFADRRENAGKRLDER
jgi:hypothetical protein